MPPLTEFQKALLPLLGVLLGALLAPFTQFVLEIIREYRAAHRAKLLVAGELLHAELILRAASVHRSWPPVLADINDFLPTSAWRENRGTLITRVSSDLYNDLVKTYALLEIDRGRFVLFDKPPREPMPPKEAEGLATTAVEICRLRQRLGGRGGWIPAPKASSELNVER